MLHVITGATGLIGSHIAEQLRAAGQPVRALVRAGSDTGFLRALGVELAEGDLHDRASISNAVRGAALVFHCAAKVVNWGPWAEFERETVATTSNVVAACREVGTPRLLHVSSVAAYGHPESPAGAQVTEDAPLGQAYWLWDYYSRSKALAEEIVGAYPNVTIVRPSWTYGPRDRITIPRLVPALLERRVPIIGPGDNLLNIIFAGDVAAGAILAANYPDAVGRAYNFSSPGEIRQVDLLNALTDALGLPRIEKHVPAFLAMRFAFVKELLAKMFFSRKPPTITRQVVALVTRRTQFSIARAERDLGWRPRTSIQDGVHRSLSWFQEAYPERLPANFRMPELPRVPA